MTLADQGGERVGGAQHPGAVEEHTHHEGPWSGRVFPGAGTSSPARRWCATEPGTLHAMDTDPATRATYPASRPNCSSA